MTEVTTQTCSGLKCRAARWLPLALLAAAWPVWPWLARRWTESPDETWGLLALAAAAALIIREARLVSAAGDSPASPPRHTAERGGLWWTAALIWLSAAAYGWLPPLARAGLALAALTSAISVCWLGKRFQVALGLLFLLALPITDSLQFFVGYPLRAMAAATAALLLRAGGLAVQARGTALQWGETWLAVDAPCSGIHMLWSGALLVAILAGYYRLNGPRLLAGGGLALVLLVLGNALRAAALFHLETSPVSCPVAAHAAVGLVSFALTAGAVTAIMVRLGNSQPCAA